MGSRIAIEAGGRPILFDTPGPPGRAPGEAAAVQFLGQSSVWVVFLRSSGNARPIARGTGGAGTEERETPGTKVPKLGLSLAPARNGGEGVVVTQVDPNGTGDAILDVNGKAVSRQHARERMALFGTILVTVASFAFGSRLALSAPGR